MVGPPPVERNLLSLFKADAKLQSKNARPAPSLELSLRVGSEEEEEAQNRPVNATIRGHDDSSHPSVGHGSSGPGHMPQQPVQAAAKGSVAAPLPSLRPPSAPRHATSIGPGYAPTQKSPNLLPARAVRRPRCTSPGSSSVGVGLHLGAGATRQQHCDMCSFYYSHSEVATTEVNLLRLVNGDLRREVWSLREELKLEKTKVRRLQDQAASSARMPQPCDGATLRCPACWARPATVVLMPREHLCLCGHCSDASRGDPAIACPLCAVARTGAVEAAPR